MVKTLKKTSSPEPIDQWPWNLVCSIVNGSTIKVVQIMTLSWPWPILRQGQIWSHRLLYGKKWKLFIFWNLLQPCLKHWAKWVNEVELVSKNKVIRWPWSKVTHISMLKLVFSKTVGRFGTDFDPFYFNLKFGHIGFCMGKSENYLFFGNYCSLRSQSCLKHLAKWVNEVEWVSKVKFICWPWSRSLRFQC